MGTILWDLVKAVYIGSMFFWLTSNIGWSTCEAGCLCWLGECNYGSLGNGMSVIMVATRREEVHARIILI